MTNKNKCAWSTLISSLLTLGTGIVIVVYGPELEESAQTFAGLLIVSFSIVAAISGLVYLVHEIDELTTRLAAKLKRTK